MFAGHHQDATQDGKKAKITDLSPGDKVTVQLSPDNKSVTKIELSLKTPKNRLDVLEKEADLSDRGYSDWRRTNDHRVPFLRFRKKRWSTDASGDSLFRRQ
jgi:hypothetical protein